MTFSFRRFGFLVCVSAMLLMGARARGAVYTMKAVMINNTPVAPQDAQAIDAMPGDRITAEVWVRDWESDAPGQRVKSLQFLMEGNNNFYRSDRDYLNVAFPGCYDIPGPFFCGIGMGEPNCTARPEAPSCRASDNICERACTNNTNCTDPSYPFCSVTGSCVGPNHDPDGCNFVDVNHPDWLFGALGSPPINACNFTGLNVTCGSVVVNGIPPLDDGSEKYVATVVIDLPDSACEEIVPELSTNSGSSFMIVTPNTAITPDVENLTITVINEAQGIIPCVTCPRLTAATPANCAVDARQPNSVESLNPGFWFNNNFDFQLTFSSLPPNGQFVQSNFSVESVPSQPAPISIDGFTANNNQVTVSVNRPPSFTGGARWMCIQWRDIFNPQCTPQKACWARLPGDANGDNLVSVADLTGPNGLIPRLNAGGLPVTRCDMDRSGACRAPDIMTWIDIANGAGALVPYLDLTLDECPTATAE